MEPLAAPKANIKKRVRWLHSPYALLRAAGDCAQLAILVPMLDRLLSSELTEAEAVLMLLEKIFAQAVFSTADFINWLLFSHRFGRMMERYPWFHNWCQLTFAARLWANIFVTPTKWFEPRKHFEMPWPLIEMYDHLNGRF